jgi:predicted RNase H-like HicB family nuclease
LAVTSVAKLRVEFDRETDSRWIAEVIDLPGVMTYGTTREEALAAVEALAVIVIAEGQESRIARGDARWLRTLTFILSLSGRGEKKFDHF